MEWIAEVLERLSRKQPSHGTIVICVYLTTRSITVISVCLCGFIGRGQTLWLCPRFFILRLFGLSVSVICAAMAIVNDLIVVRMSITFSMTRCSIFIVNCWLKMMNPLSGSPRDRVSQQLLWYPCHYYVQDFDHL